MGRNKALLTNEKEPQVMEATSAMPYCMRPLYPQPVIRDLVERFEKSEIDGPMMNFAARTIREGMRVHSDRKKAYQGWPLSYRIVHDIMVEGPKFMWEILSGYIDVPMYQKTEALGDLIRNSELVQIQKTELYDVPEDRLDDGEPE